LRITTYTKEDDMTAPEPASAERDAGYYREDYGRHEPDWIPQPDGVPSAAWDRYLTSQPGSDEHKAAYAAMHREADGRGFPGPDPAQSYLADHGYAARPDRAPEAGEASAEPDDAVPIDREPLDLDRLYGRPGCELEPEAG
jgi:hypothetical protein